MNLFLILLLLGFLINAQAKTVTLESYSDRPIIEKEAKAPTDKLIIMLHAVKTSANFMNLYYPLATYVNDYNFNLIIPSGSKNRKGKRYWNAGEACCDFYDDGADDLLYLDKLISYYKEKYGSQKIYLVGHSNGAFMANYYACHGKHPIQGFFSFAGNPAGPLKDCKNFSNLKAIHAHGQSDSYVPYFGGELRNGGHNSIPVSTYLADYQKTLGCSDFEFKAKRNFTLNKPGKDFNLYESKRCANKNKLIFWDHFDGGHIPRFNNQYFKEIIKALLF